MLELGLTAPVGVRIAGPDTLEAAALPLPGWRRRAERQVRCEIDYRARRSRGALPLDLDALMGEYRYDPRREKLRIRIEPTVPSRRAAIRLAMVFAAERLGAGLVLHATGLTRRGRAFVGLAESGGGKSTLTDLAEGWASLSDETVYVEPAAEGATAHGLPFRSAARKVPEPLHAPVSAFLLLDKAPRDSYRRLDPSAALRAILQQAYRPNGLVLSHAAFLKRASALARSAPCFRFSFRKAPSAAALLDRLDEELAR